MRITATTIDGKTYSCEAQHFMSTGDRVAFEHRFGASTATLNKFKDYFDDEGNPIPGKELGEFREEWTVFFSWRELRRQCSDVTASYDDFVDNLDELTVKDPKKQSSEAETTDVVEDEAEPDPNLTAAAAQRS